MTAASMKKLLWRQGTCFPPCPLMSSFLNLAQPLITWDPLAHHNYLVRRIVVRIWWIKCMSNHRTWTTRSTCINFYFVLVKTRVASPRHGLVAIRQGARVCKSFPSCVQRACNLAQLCPTLRSPMDCSPPGSLSAGFSRQEYWSGLSFPPPGDLPDPGSKPTSLASPALAGRFFTTVPPGKPMCEAPFVHIGICKWWFWVNLLIITEKSEWN